MAKAGNSNTMLTPDRIEYVGVNEVLVTLKTALPAPPSPTRSAPPRCLSSSISRPARSTISAPRFSETLACFRYQSRSCCWRSRRRLAQEPAKTRWPNMRNRLPKIRPPRWLRQMSGSGN